MSTGTQYTGQDHGEEGDGNKERASWNAAEQHQSADDPEHDQVEQMEGHKPRSCRTRLIWPNRRPPYLLRVMERYTLRCLSVTQRASHQSGSRLYLGSAATWPV